MEPPTIDLNGDWICHYRGHHDEIVRIVRQGNMVEAAEGTGDPNAPTGEVTFRAEIDGMQGKSEGQIAEAEFRNPRFIPGRLRILEENHIEFEWSGLGKVEFHRNGDRRVRICILQRLDAARSSLAARP